jgi:hypothetical protein
MPEGRRNEPKKELPLRPVVKHGKDDGGARGNPSQGPLEEDEACSVLPLQSSSQ